MIKLKQVKPEPVYDGGKSIESGVWNTNLTFDKGKHYLVTAPSGKGKSTLLHIIYGLRKDFDGEVYVKDKSTNKISNNEWSDLRQSVLSIVFQDLRLFPNLSARENILLNAQLQGNFNSDLINPMAERLGISEYLDKPSNTLSYGQRQRIAIIRALCQPFDFILLDEPFSHLDEDNCIKASQLIEEEVKKQGAGLILVSLGEKFHFNYDHEYVL